jgi:hypothetical protein
MKSAWHSRPLRLALLAVMLLHVSAGLIFAADPPTTAPSFDRLVSEYMAGKWDDLDADLKAIVRQPATLTASQKADIDYIRQTLAECRPLWWTRSESGKRTQIRMSIFNVPITAIYDPQQKQGMNVRFSENTRAFTLGWVPEDMVSTAPAEHGFTKGELGAGGVWSTLGMTAGYTVVPFRSLMNMTEIDKIKLTRDLDFQGNLAAAYYGNPRTRQWWFFLSMHYYKPQYATSSIVMSRKALGAMFVAEVATHPEQYPSIRLPATLEPEGAENRLVGSVHDWIERHGWTLAEDKLLRQATKAFALANASVIRTGGPVKLANGLQISLEPAEDTALQLERDHWLAQKWMKN